MTRKSERELERDIEALEGPAPEDAALSEFFWVNLKAYYDAELTPAERRLLAASEDRFCHETRLAD